MDLRHQGDCLTPEPRRGAIQGVLVDGGLTGLECQDREPERGDPTLVNLATQHISTAAQQAPFDTNRHGPVRARGPGRRACVCHRIRIAWLLATITIKTRPLMRSP